MRICLTVALLSLLLLAGGCASEEPGISPDRDRFYFPTGMALDPQRPLLYVACSNADLAFNGGTLVTLDLTRLPADLRRVGELVTQKKLDCEPARTDITGWECDEAQFIDPDATLRMGDFPSTVRVASDGSRLFVPVRGQNYLLWADILDRDAGQRRVDLRCDTEACANSASSENCTAWDCDVEHRVDYSEELRQSLPEEPFGIVVNELVAVHVGPDGARRTCRDGLAQAPSCDCPAASECQGEHDVGCCHSAPAAGRTHVYLTHLYGGEVSFFTSGPEGVVLRDIRGGFFTPSSSGVRGAFALAPRRPGDPDSRIYVSSRVDSVLASFIVRDNSRIVDEGRVSMGALYPGNDSRDLVFSPGGDRLYVVSQQPASLVAFDMSLEYGHPKGEPLWIAEVCAEPSLTRLDPALSRAYVVCFGTAQIFVVDTSLGTVIDQIETGNGPNELVLDPSNHRAFVANFLENSVGVIDMDPSHSTYHRMVVRIGLQKDLVKH